MGEERSLYANVQTVDDSVLSRSKLKPRTCWTRPLQISKPVEEFPLIWLDPLRRPATGFRSQSDSFETHACSI